MGQAHTLARREDRPLVLRSRRKDDGADGAKLRAGVPRRLRRTLEARDAGDLCVQRASLDRGLGDNASGEWVFPAENRDEPLSIGNLYWFWIMAPGMAGLMPDARLHDQRHAHALHAAMNGESLHVTGRLIGHRRAFKTNRYDHLHETILSQAAERVPTALECKLLRDNRPVAGERHCEAVKGR